MERTKRNTLSSHVNIPFLVLWFSWKLLNRSREKRLRFLLSRLGELNEPFAVLRNRRGYLKQNDQSIIMCFLWVIAFLPGISFIRSYLFPFVRTACLSYPYISAKLVSIWKCLLSSKKFLCKRTIYFSKGKKTRFVPNSRTINSKFLSGNCPGLLNSGNFSP